MCNTNNEPLAERFFHVHLSWEKYIVTGTCYMGAQAVWIFSCALWGWRDKMEKVVGTKNKHTL